MKPVTTINSSESSMSSNKVRTSFAISIGKLAGASGRFFKIGGGTSLPGMIARYIDPAILRDIMSKTRAKKIVVTGSNGKTTTSRMIAALAKGAGKSISQNRTGSNLLQGVTSVAVNQADILGNLDKDLLVFEIDEATMSLAIPEIHPDVVIVTNLFRDQLDRYGEMYSIAKSLDALLLELPKTSTILLNGNDPLVANLAQGAQAKRLYFGLEDRTIGTNVPEQSADTIRCIHCQEDLIYDIAYMSHLGIYTCPNCGYTLPSLDIAATHITLAEDGASPSTVTLRVPDDTIELHVPLPGLHNVYNAIMALGAMIAVDYPITNASQSLQALQTAFGRLEKIQTGEKTIYLSFVKNPTSFNLILRLIKQHSTEKKRYLIAFSNTVVDGEDFAWLWDVEFEPWSSNNIQITCAGNKANEIATRLKYADIPVHAIRTIPSLEEALDTSLASLSSDETLYILCGYTPTHEIRRIMQRRGWVKPFWEE